MALSQQPFRYRDRITGGQLRLMHIQPGARDSHISFSLVTVERGHTPAYKALSYTWGDVIKTHIIYIDNQVFYIHTNLYEAIQEIRSADDDVTLWTDRICINQDDTHERNIQVQQMGLTYSEADEVLIWLGPEGPHSNALEDVASLKDWTKADYDGKIPSVQDVLMRPWFQRLWVVQEAALAPKGKFMIGTHQCALDDLLQINVYHILAAAVRPKSKLSPIERTSLEKTLLQLGQLKWTRQWVTKKTERSERDLVRLCRPLRCYDPRDHVFGLVGMVQQMGAQASSVDYDVSVRTLFTQLMISILEHSGDALYVDGAGEVLESELNLPSWVPDWSNDMRAPEFYHDIFSAGGAGSELQFTQEMFPMEGLLSVTGLFVDTVSYISAVHTDSPAWTHTDWLHLETRFTGYDTAPSKYGDYQSRLQAYWRTTVANTFQLPSVWAEKSIPWSEDDSGAEYEVFIGRARPARPGNEPGPPDDEMAANTVFVRNYAGALSNYLRNRRLFITSSGYFGLGACHMQLEDLIVVVPGLKMPLAVKKRPCSGKYQLLGGVYVHGIMNGEFVESRAEVGTLSDLETFVFD